VQLARSTRQAVRTNQALAVTASIVTLPVAAAGLLTPLVALGAPALAGLCIVANSLRARSLRSARPPAHKRRRRGIRR
jgi:Cu+-exporting ATPase